MSHSRKHLAVSVLQTSPEVSETERIARVIGLRGANICEVEYPNGERILCQIPTKFRKLIWIKTGNFVIVREPKNMPKVKVRAMVEHVLFPDHIKTFKSENKWPQEFEVNLDLLKTDKQVQLTIKKKGSEEGSEDEEDADLFVNPNHNLVQDDSDDEESSEEDE